jgi:hypothetical protein
MVLPFKKPAFSPKHSFRLQTTLQTQQNKYELFILHRFLTHFEFFLCFCGFFVFLYFSKIF